MAGRDYFRSTGRGGRTTNGAIIRCEFTGTASGTQVIQKCGSTENTKLESGNFERKMVYLQNRMQKEAEITLIGEPVTMGSLAAGIEKKYGHSVRVFLPIERM